MTGSCDETLQASEVHGLPFAHGVAATERQHNDGEEGIDEKIEPVRGIPAAAAFVDETFVHLGKKCHKDGRDHQNQCQSTPLR